MYFLALISLIWIAYRLGKDEGKWGLLIAIAAIFLIGIVATIFRN